MVYLQTNITDLFRNKHNFIWSAFPILFVIINVIYGEEHFEFVIIKSMRVDAELSIPIIAQK